MQLSEFTKITELWKYFEKNLIFFHFEPKNLFLEKKIEIEIGYILI